MSTFVLELDALSTPAGLIAACESARTFVEANIPGKHHPGPGGYYRHDIDEVPIGCRCAIGYLRTAMCGGIQESYDIPNDDLVASWKAAGGTAWQIYEFERGFDRGFIGSQGLDDNPWYPAGMALGRKWATEQGGEK